MCFGRQEFFNLSLVLDVQLASENVPRGFKCNIHRSGQWIVLEEVGCYEECSWRIDNAGHCHTFKYRSEISFLQDMDSFTLGL